MTITSNAYTGDGSTVLFTFSWPYLEKEDVFVQINEDIQARPTAWDFANTNTVEFVTAPTAGARVSIYRRTNVDDLYYTFYPGSTIKAKSLNNDFEQTLFVAQESQNQYLDVETGGDIAGDVNFNGDVVFNKSVTINQYPTADTDAANKLYVDTQDVAYDSAVRSWATSEFVNASGDQMAGQLDMTNHKIVRLAVPQDSSDAVNKQYVDGILAGTGGNISSLPVVRYILTAVGGETVINPEAPIAPGNEIVTVNGSTLTPSDDYTINGTDSITLRQPLLADDQVMILSYNSLKVVEVKSNFETYPFTRWVDTATAGQTVFQGNGDGTVTLGYSPGYEQVTLNGSRLVRDVDYIANDKLSVILTQGALAGDILEVLCGNYLKTGDQESYAASDISYTYPGGRSQNVQKRLESTVSVKDFGAKGDGVTDDYAAITAAITAAAGKTLIFPAGTYSITQTIVFDQSDSVIKGEGAVIITMPDNINREWSVGNIGRSTIGVANGVAPTETVLLEGITFDFNANRRGVVSGTGSNKDDAYEKNAFTVANAKNITIRDCSFLNGFRHCLDITTPIKKSIGSLTQIQRLLQMPVLPNVGGTEVFGAQYITIENCYFAGGGDDNLTTHYCSNVYITNCRSESPYGGYSTGSGNHNGFEIDDGSRNINITDCTAIRCFSAIEVKAHDYAPAPYNVIVKGLQAINCASAVEIHHTNWEGPVSGNSDNAYSVLLVGSPGTITLAAGTDQEVVCVDGISPMARNVSVSNVQIIAPTTVNYFTRDSNNVFTPATLLPSRCFEVGGYDGVQVSNILFNDGRSDTALTEDGFADPVVFDGNIGLIHLHDGCRNVSFSNVHVTGFGGSVPLTNRVFDIVSNCFDAINCSNLTVVEGPNQIVEATGASQAYYGIFSGVVARSSVTKAGPALDSSNENLRFEQPDITGYTETIDVQEVVLEKSPGMPGDGRGIGSVHVDTNTGVLRTKTTKRSSSDWNSLGALAWARYSGSSDAIRKSNNIEGIVKNGTGDYTVTLSPDLVFSSPNDFCCLVTSSLRQTVVSAPTIDGNGKASFTIKLYDASTVLADGGFVNIVVFGVTI